MKKLVALTLFLALTYSLISCTTTQVYDATLTPQDTTQGTTLVATDSIISLWEGEFSENELKDGIQTYVEKYNTIVLDPNQKIASVSFEVDFEVAHCRVARLSRTDKQDMEVELKGAIDLYLNTQQERKKVTIPIDWWHRIGSWVQNFPVWSYLILLKDAEENQYWYYFRVDYSAFKTAEGTTEQALDNYLFCSWHKDRTQNYVFTQEEKTYLLNIFNNGKWLDSLFNCYFDYTFYMPNQTIEYSSTGGTFNDITNTRCMEVSEEERIAINQILGIEIETE